MQAHIVSTGTSSRNQSRRSVVMAMGSIALALAAVVGFARWQAMPQATTEPATVGAARVTANSIPEPEGSQAGAGLRYVYLVGS